MNFTQELEKLTWNFALQMMSMFCETLICSSVSTLKIRLDGTLLIQNMQTLLK